MNRILIITDGFPPVTGAGIKRILKFMKYLQIDNWTPVILTPDNVLYSPTDSTLMKEFDEKIDVYRTYTFESLFKSNNKTESKLDDPKNIAIKKHLKFSRFKIKIYKFFGQFLKLPDSHVLWIPSAVYSGIKIIKKHNCNVILSTGPSFTSMIIGAILKFFKRKKLVLDFRDAWISDPMLVFDKKYVEFIHKTFEKFVIRNSDLVISTNPFVTKDFQTRYASSDASKFLTIYNGYDMDDLSEISGRKPIIDESKINIVYSGRLYAERTPKYFLKAIGEVIKEYPDLASKIQVYFIGSCEKFLDGKFIEDYIENYNLKNLVKLTGHISRIDSLLYQKSADILLLLIGIVPADKSLTYGISGKLFDYILFKKPVLTLANEGATREFILENNVGTIYYHEDIQNIKKYIIRLCASKFNSADTSPQKDILYPQFDFSFLTKNLISHLNRIITEQDQDFGNR